MYISQINGANFQAKLDYSRVKNNSKNWEEVAKSFSQKTSNYKNSAVDVYETQEHIILNFFKNIKNDLDGIMQAKINKKDADLLFIVKDKDTIATKIAKLLDISINTAKELKNADKFANKMAEKVQSDSEKNLVYDHFYGEAYTLTRNEVLRQTFSDEIMKNWKVII